MLKKGEACHSLPSPKHSMVLERLDDDTKWIDGYINLFHSHIFPTKKYGIFIKSSASAEITDKHYLPWDYLSNLRNGNMHALQSLPNDENIVKELFTYLDKFRQFGATHLRSPDTQSPNACANISSKGLNLDTVNDEQVENEHSGSDWKLDRTHKYTEKNASNKKASSSTAHLVLAWYLHR